MVVDNRGTYFFCQPPFNLYYMVLKNLIIFTFLILIVSCSSIEDKSTNSNAKWEHKIKVEEVIQTTSYTYLLAEENGNSRWIAVSSMDTKEGDILYYNNGLEMVDFNSRELNRVFPNLLLVQIISDGKSEMPIRKTVSNNSNNVKKGVPITTKKDAEYVGIVTLNELFSNTQKYSGKVIEIKGKVVKFNPSIMGKNWIHIVDDNGKNDLTITTQDVVELNNIVNFKGIITLNKDFGAGYKYAVIMEEGELK